MPSASAIAYCQASPIQRRSRSTGYGDRYWPLRVFVDLPERLERLKQPAGPNAESLATLGKLFAGRLETDPVFAVAYLAKQLSTNSEASQSFLRSLNTITTGLANYKKVEALVAADPSILKRLEEFAASQRKKDP